MELIKILLNFAKIEINIVSDLDADMDDLLKTKEQ